MGKYSNQKSHTTITPRKNVKFAVIHSLFYKYTFPPCITPAGKVTHAPADSGTSLL